MSEFEIARFGTNDVLDPTFGAGGAVLTALSPPSDKPSHNDLGSIARAVGIQADGKIVAAGQANVSNGGPPLDFAQARYSPDGTLDGSFGSNGTPLLALNIQLSTEASLCRAQLKKGRSFKTKAPTCGLKWGVSRHRSWPGGAAAPPGRAARPP